jgi:hypothetical protein
MMTPTSGRLWRLKYRVDGVERKLWLGKYPEVLLAEARKARDAARAMMSARSDPAAAKRRERVSRRLAVGTTFEAVAQESIVKAEKDGRSPATIAKLHWVRKWPEPALGRRPIDQIEPHELLAVLKSQETKGQLETARGTRRELHVERVQVGRAQFGAMRRQGVTRARCGLDAVGAVASS